MILTCPSCGSRFQIPDGALGTAGRKVKCSACKHVWFQAPEAVAADAPPPIAEETAPQRPDSDAEPSVEAKTDPDVPQVATADQSAPEILPPTDTPSLIAAETVSEIEAQEVPDSDTSESHQLSASQPTAESAALGMSDNVRVDSTPDFDVSRVVGPDDADGRSPRGRGRAILLVVLLLVAAGAALYQWRTDVLQAFPQTLPAYAALDLIGPPSSQNLKLEDVAFEVLDENGDKVLIVSGRVVNAGPDLSLLPMLRAELLDQAGQVTTFWTFVATAEVLAPGGDTGFRDIYPDPPVTGDETDILVTFDDLR